MDTSESGSESSPSVPAPREAKRSRARRLAFAFGVASGAALVIIAVAVVLLLQQSFLSTKFLDSEGFSGIAPLKKTTTSVIIVHGIGTHCIGYADPLISNLMKGLTDPPHPKPIAEHYKSYYKSYEESIVRANLGKYGVSMKDGAYRGDYIDIPRDGHCNKIELEGLAKLAKEASKKVDTGDDLETLTSAQDKLCEFVNDKGKHGTSNGDVKVSCHKLSVDRAGPVVSGENREYITGFVRVFERKVSGVRRVRVYEVTWSPATRWIKQSLSGAERFNSEMSQHLVNDFLKTKIMNASIADAIAYLSESGVLVNFNILQAFCLALANAGEESSISGYAFTCDTELLKKTPTEFSKDNDVILISHSLGTRVVLDSIGLLSRGANAGAPSGPDLMGLMSAKFQQIGALVPEQYADMSESGFAGLLKTRIPEFARAIRSVYIFTNQVPLLAATVSSPFRQTHDVGHGFQDFLKLRMNGTGGPPLQIVSFHDPDDLLSYNLNCWYHVAVLKNAERIRTILDAEAKYRAESGRTSVGEEHRKLRDDMFANNCSARKFTSKGDIDLFRKIQENELLELRTATVRLKGFRIGMLAADPLDVHSNYFLDPLVHRWIVNGTR
jgi:hypothetical protein